jgi:hypothetical protein
LKIPVKIRVWSIWVRLRSGIVPELQEGSAKPLVINEVYWQLLASKLKLALDIAPKSVILGISQVLGLGPLAEKDLPPTFQFGGANASQISPPLEVAGHPLHRKKFRKLLAFRVGDHAS